MERIEALIQKLKEQLGQKASPAQLLFTVQLLQQEISQLEQTGSRTLGTSKVSVVLPQGMNIAPAHEKYAPKITEEPPAMKEVKQTVWVENGSVSFVQKDGQLDMVFDPMTEIPTLSHQPKEVNEKAGQVESLNDILKEGKTELMEMLKETPVKDLRKAIGINDRFLFINDLFRGDETMYERSIKTINSFNIFAEAEYWISREMKVKLGWNNDHPTVQHFDQLVKRRFS
jgi:hypothetical protein